MKKTVTALFFLLCSLALPALLAGCSGTSSKTASGGGYYKDDGPMARTPKDIANIPDAVPRIEPFSTGTLRPYTVMGLNFVPIGDSTPFSEEGIASWYGKKFHGRQTANGERYDMFAMTAAHPTLPLPSYAKVTRMDNKKSVIVRINDRGPFHASRIIDLSYAAAAKLDMIGPGHAKVKVEAITHDDIRAGRYQSEPSPAYAQADQAGPSESAAPSAQPDNAAGPSARVQSAYYSADHQEADPLGAFLSTQRDPGATHSAADSESASGPSRKDGYFLQFGAFSSSESAHQLAQRVRDNLPQGLPQAVHISDQRSLYRVRLGPFNSRTEAVNAAMLVQQRTGQSAHIAYED